MTPACDPPPTAPARRFSTSWSTSDFGMGFTLEDAAVADLFAGTGALGIEALSRGRALLPVGG